MGPRRVVVVLPSLKFAPNFFQRSENVHIQEFVPKASKSLRIGGKSLQPNARGPRSELWDPGSQIASLAAGKISPHFG